MIFRRTEGGIIRNWGPKKEIIAEELEELRRTTHIQDVTLDYEQSLFFSVVRRAKRETRKWPRA